MLVIVGLVVVVVVGLVVVQEELGCDGCVIGFFYGAGDFDLASDLP